MKPQSPPAVPSINFDDDWEDPVERLDSTEEDEDGFDEMGLAPIEDTPSTLRPRATNRMLVENLAVENDILLEQDHEDELGEDPDADLDDDAFNDAEEL